MKNKIEKANAGTIAKQEFGGNSLTTTGETASTVLAVRAKAEVEARFIMAMQMPRSWDMVREKLLHEVERPGFAETAWYQIPNRGEGFTIRFAEAALRNIRNIDARSEIIYEDDSSRIVLVTVFDLENNVSIPTTISIEKTIERKKLKRGEIAISERANSYGEVVYKRATTADELLTKTNSAISKALRNGILRLLPGDIQADCSNRINAIRRGAAAADPDGYKKKILDSFALLKISSNDLEKLLGHTVDKATDEELVMLRSVHSALKSGEMNYTDLFAEEKTDEEKSPMDKLKDKLKVKIEVIEPTIEEEQDAEMSAIDKVNALANQMFGAKATEALQHRRDEHGINMDEMTEDEAEKLLGILVEEKHQ